jgi:hypothetical protein
MNRYTGRVSIIRHPGDFGRCLAERRELPETETGFDYVPVVTGGLRAGVWWREGSEGIRDWGSGHLRRKSGRAVRCLGD